MKSNTIFPHLDQQDILSTSPPKIFFSGWLKNEKRRTCGLDLDVGKIVDPWSCNYDYLRKIKILKKLYIFHIEDPRHGPDRAVSFFKNVN